LGEGDTILVRGSHELIVGGPHGKVFVGGPGHDLVIERYADATIVLESPDDEVRVSGHDDRVECLHGAAHEEIEAAASDRTDKACHGRRNVLRQFANHRVTALATAGPTAICADPSNQGLGKFAHPCPLMGEGTNANPYTTSASACPPEDDP